MINIKLERLIFLIILLSMVAIIGKLAADYKMNYISINYNVSPEELIEYSYKSCDTSQYNYLIVGNHMFIVSNNQSNEYGQFRKACKINNKSGYLLEMPGIFRFSIYSTRIERICTPDGDIITVIVSKYKSEYTIEIWDLKENNITYYNDGELMNTLTLDNIVNFESFTVLKDPNESVNVYGIQNGQRFKIIDNQDIIGLF